jgi:dolichol-phosphate mannosyltransferase
MSAAVNLYARLLLGLNVKDCSSGYRCYRTDAVADIDWGHIRSDGFSFEEEFLWRLKQRGARLTEIPFTFVERKKGSSKINLKEAFVAFWVIPLVAVGRLSACRR